MNPFEKIFNYQILSRLNEAGVAAITSQERAWLQAVLTHPAAAEFLAPDTLDKLRELLADEPPTDLSDVLLERAGSAPRQVAHPLLRELRRLLLRGSSIRLVYELKNGGSREQTGLPYRLEYSMVRREWYLLWLQFRGNSQMATPLRQIIRYTEMPASDAQAKQARRVIAARAAAARQEAVIEVVNRYNAELSRILYALSCFDKRVDYEAETDVYRIRLIYPADESEFLLSKLRFLGKRVRIAEGAALQRRMAQTAAWALARYDAAAEESSEAKPDDIPIHATTQEA